MRDDNTTDDPTTRMIEAILDPTLRLGLERGLGEYCHQSRNRLNSLKLCIYLAKRQSAGVLGSSWHDVEADYRSIETHLEQVQAICHPAGLALVGLPLNLLFEDRRVEWTRVMAEQGRALRFDPPERPAVARFDVSQLGRALDLLVEWRAGQGAAAGAVTVRWGLRLGQAFIDWIEDEFVPATDPSGSNSDPEFVWSLPILARLIADQYGTIHLATRRGWQLAIAWPT